MDVQLGDSGPYVRAVQRIVGVPTSKVDGVVGPFTAALITSWQERHGITPGDGVFGPLSRAQVDACSLIQAYEGLVLQAYDDHPGPLASRLLTWDGKVWQRADGAVCVGNPTIGWGTRIWSGQETIRQRCTRAQADRWLQDFVTRQLGPELEHHLPKDADAAQRAALCSLGYNGGPGAIVAAAHAGFDPDWWRGHYITPSYLSLRRAEEAALWAAA